jgi:hypothetical protein
MEQAEFERIREKIDSEIRTRFAGAPIERVEVLQYGDDPKVEPGELLARVHLEGSDDTDDDRPALDAFHDAHKAALRRLHEDMPKISVLSGVEFLVGAEEGQEKRKVLKIGLGGGPGRGMNAGDGQLTAVMARLGADDLQTLDTLITAGIASSRAEGMRWALARIRERPAYEQLRTHAKQIEELKSQF